MESTLASYHHIETLPDGKLVELRAIRPSDRDKLREEFLKLSKASVRDRFFSIKLDLTPSELTYFTEVDFDHHLAFLDKIPPLGSQTALGPVNAVVNVFA